jgi:hypothetical protein
MGIDLPQVSGTVANYREANTHTRVTLGEPDDLFNGRLIEKIYSKTRCPQDTSSTAFSGTSIYWRPNDNNADRPSNVTEDEGESVAKIAGDAEDEKELMQKLKSITLDE